MSLPLGPNALPVLERRYLARDPDGRAQETPAQMLDRVAGAVARAEEPWGGSAAVAEARGIFTSLMTEGRFLPNSPTLMNAGRPLGQLSACFVLPVPDDLGGIFQALQESALIHKSGGGTGFSFSRLRPAGDVVATTQGVSSGPLSFMRVFDQATEAVKQGGTRRGANMAILDASHPDIELFVEAKSRPGVLENFNLSVMATDGFWEAARRGAPWPLINPRDGRVTRTIEAADLLERIVAAAHASGEPGLAFYEAINRANPTPELGEITATNPCGEQPLLPYESCNLGSLNLPAFVRGGRLDTAALEQAAMQAVRFLDDVVEINRFPLEAVTRATRATRKVGLGVMGFADLLLDLGVAYADPAAATLAEEVMAAISGAARVASRDLGRRRGSFPAFGHSRLTGEYTHMRNATVTTVAPTGTLSLILGASSGIEPHFALAYTRQVLGDQRLSEVNRRFRDRLAELGLDSPANLTSLAETGSAAAIPGLPPEQARLFATAHEIAPEAHLAVQAAFQRHTDNGVSKTVNLPAGVGPEEVRRVFIRAHELGLKGVTVFRHGCRGRQVLELAPLPGRAGRAPAAGQGRCPRCGGEQTTDGGCLTCAWCGASGCE